MKAIDILKGYLTLGEDIVSEEYLRGIAYKFYNNNKYSKISNGFELNRIYWNEILTRIHWASITTIQRNISWGKGILQSYSDNNFLPFAGNLRSFIESNGDSMTSLSPIPLTIARDFKQISNCVLGRKINPVTNPQLEEMLIHFHYARKLTKSEKALDSTPKSHEAEFVTKYLEILDSNSKDGPVNKMYSELCQFTHPAAHSVLLNMEGFKDDDYTVLSYKGNTAQTIMDEFIDKYQDPIITVCSYGFNNAFVLLKLLNLFNIAGISTPKLSSIELTNINVWNKAVELINNK